MDRFLKKLNFSQPSSSFRESSPRVIDELNLKTLKFDPGERIPIDKYSPRIRDEVRRHYIQQGPCQSDISEFPQTRFGNKMCRFNSTWFKGSYSRWLEYNEKKDAAFCLCCYLFKNDYVKGSAGDFFTKIDFKDWNHHSERFALHICEVNSVHNRCSNKMLDLENQSQSIQVSFDKQSEKMRSEHRIRLEASTNVTRFLLKFGLSFRGHDESESSKNKGLFLGLLEWLEKMLPDVNSVNLKHAPQNDMMTSSKIQKEIVNACAQETMKAILDDLDGYYFGILADEFKDISHHEQMALALRYVNKKGKVNEPVIAIVRVGDPSAQSLKEIICSFLLRHSLSTSKIRGQGYDGASNMQRDMNGLKTLILQETPLAYSIHCFAPQLQWTLVAVAKKHLLGDNFFAIITNVLNVFGASFKCRDQLWDHQEVLEQLLESGKVQSGKGLNQE